jgi:hypothetical protein
MELPGPLKVGYPLADSTTSPIQKLFKAYPYIGMIPV